MFRIALDLELEQPRTNKQTPDSMLDSERIIQVGYVVFDDNTGNVYSRIKRHVYVPELKLSAFIRQLTGISDADIDNGSSLEVIVEELHLIATLFNTDRRLITWGGGDQESIRSELAAAGCTTQWAFGRSAINAKHLFQVYCEANSINSRGGLKKSMNKLGLKFEGRAHDALTDAENTARIFTEIKKRLKQKGV